MPTLPQKTAVDKAAEIDWAAALQTEMRTVVRQAIEHLVGAELGAVLGPPYARGEARLGYRHGSKVRTMTVHRWIIHHDEHADHSRRRARGRCGP
jgi:hypothetical protein